jgi:hypothetical protein
MDEHQEERSPRAPRFLRLFLLMAGGLAAPCLALAAFFLSNSGGSDIPAAKSAVVDGAKVTTTIRARPSPVATATSTTTTTTTAQPSRPPRDPFAPLVTQAPAASPAR